MDGPALQQIGLLTAEAALTISVILAAVRLRGILGLAPLYIVLGVIQPIQVMLGASIFIAFQPGLLISPGSTILFASNLAAVLLIYVLEDALEARKAIYGIALANLAMTVLLVVTSHHLDLAGTRNLLYLPQEIFRQSARTMLIGVNNIPDGSWNVTGGVGS